MKVLNNVIASELRKYLVEGQISLGIMYSLYKHIKSESDPTQIIYNAKTLMGDIETIVKELKIDKTAGNYSLVLLTVLLSGLGVIFEEGSLFTPIDDDRDVKFNALYNECKTLNINKLEDLKLCIVMGALSESLVAEIMIKNAEDVNNIDEENIIGMSQWETIYNIAFKGDDNLKHILLEIGECIRAHTKHRNIDMYAQGILYENMKTYHMI